MLFNKTRKYKFSIKLSFSIIEQDKSKLQKQIYILYKQKQIQVSIGQDKSKLQKHIIFVNLQFQLR